MSNDCYEIACEHATNEIAEINAQIERLIRRKELLENLLVPLKLLVPESDPVTIPATVPDGSNSESPATETAAQESPVVVLVDVSQPESGSVAIPVMVSDGSNSESPATDIAAQESSVVLVDVSQPESVPFEDSAPMMQPEVEETNVDARSNGVSIRHEDIAELAYSFWNERGQAHGHHEEDWSRAAHELQNSA
ncbi:MAG: DUF2934 domain-containing protein [Terracidiphilus sp.]